MENHDNTVQCMLTDDQDNAIGLTGRTAEMQFMRLASEYTNLVDDMAEKDRRIAELEEKLKQSEHLASEYLKTCKRLREEIDRNSEGVLDKWLDDSPVVCMTEGAYAALVGRVSNA